MLHENVDLEYKERYVSDIKKEVIAFANTEGGILYVGIGKDGTVIGVDNPDEIMLQIAGSLKDSIKPDVMPFVQIRSIIKEDKTVVEVAVEVGDGRPYYLYEKGLKSGGVYVCRGSSTQPLSEEGIRAMIVENTGLTYENCRSVNQELTFAFFEKEMRDRGIEFGPSQMRTLHFVGEDGLYTNLALLLSDQCEHSIKMALYQGSDKTVFRSRKEFTGSLLKQLKEAIETVDFYNKTKATFHGILRSDKRDYPVDAVRETLLNCIVHRDYSFSGSTLINLYDDRLEFVSLGGIVPGISMQAIYMGVSQPRNINLAAIFYRMELIESYGTGISKIQESYFYEKLQPKFETATGVFRVILPNRNEEISEVYERIRYHNDSYNHNISYTQGGIVSDVVRTVPMENKDKILKYAQTVTVFTRKDIEELLKLKTTSVFNLLKELCDEGVIRPVGKGKNSHYELTNYPRG